MKSVNSLALIFKTVSLRSLIIFSTSLLRIFQNFNELFQKEKYLIFYMFVFFKT